MADERVYLVAWLRSKPGKEAELEALLRGMCSPSRAEEGCVFYNLLRAAEGEKAFHFIECWKNQAALDEHRQTPHYKQFREKVQHLIAEPPGVRALQGMDTAF